MPTPEQRQNKITVNPDGSMTVEMSDGRKVELDAQGNFKMDPSSIKSVGFHNLIDLAKHNITKHEGLVSHAVTFKDGGHVAFAYEATGKLTKFQIQKVDIAFSKEKEVMVYMKGRRGQTNRT